MLPKKPIFLFAFANPRRDLSSLSKEEEKLRNLLAPLEDQGKIECRFMGYSTLDQIFKEFNRYHNRIALFHYGGHSGDDFLELDDKEARAGNLAGLMGQQKNLQLVFLNGCANVKQLDELQEAGVKTVLATSAPIGDEKALNFAGQFYDALRGGKNLDESFNTAKNFIENDHPQLNVQKRAGRKKAEEAGSDQFPWGLYTLEDQSADWIIPNPIPEPENPDYHTEVNLMSQDVNKVLVEKAFEGMSHYELLFKDYWERYQRRPSGSVLNQLQNMMLDYLPSILSTQIRDLFTVEGKTQGRRRLKEIYEAYLTLARLVSAISICNLWDEVFLAKKSEEGEVKIRDAYKEELRQFLNLDPVAAESFDYFWLTATIKRIFDENKITAYMEELEALKESLINADETYEAYRFMEQEVRTRLLAKNILNEEVEDLCLAAEEKLGMLLSACGFMCKYQLVTIKDVELQSPYRAPTASFIHQKSILRGHDYVIMDDEPLQRPEYISNQSVLIVKDIYESATYLNLSPILIDENAFRLKSDLPKLYFYGGKKDDQIIYEQAETFENKLQIEPNYDKRQYRKLETIFHQFDWIGEDLEL
jgi:hypothetical protein